MKLPEGYINGVAPKKATAMGGFGQSVLEKLGWQVSGTPPAHSLSAVLITSFTPSLLIFLIAEAYSRLQKGEGLGKNKQGIDVPVSVTKKGDNVGLGGKRGWDSQQDFAIQAYETAMAKVTAQASEDDSSSDSSDEESDFSAAICNETSATAEELKLSRQLAKGNNLGRFGARAGKLQRIQEQEQAAVLGMVNATASGSCQAPQSKADMQKAPGSTAPASEVVPRAKIITVGALEEAAEPLPPPEPKPDTWWGHKVFASSGWLEGLNQNKRKARDAFTHDTQAAIYNSAMSKKIQVCRLSINATTASTVPSTIQYCSRMSTSFRTFVSPLYNLLLHSV